MIASKANSAANDTVTMNAKMLMQMMNIIPSLGPAPE
jgi:hypothetical protein